MTVAQSSDRAIIHWDDFSVGQSNSVHFVQPSASSAVLNRVRSDTPSIIAGNVTGNGQVYLVNPNGIAITPTGNVAIDGGFVASTLDIADSDFETGRMRYAGTGGSAPVTNSGRVAVGSGGFVALLGGRVSNSGVISVPLGKVGLGAGERATLDLTGDGFLQVVLPAADRTQDGSPLIDVAGTIDAASGRIELRTATAQQAVRDVVHISGALSASSAYRSGGAIVLESGQGSTLVSGDIVARSDTSTGGTIVIGGDTVRLNNALMAVDGGSKGGSIFIGGATLGATMSGATRARVLDVDKSSQIIADARFGTGGEIVLWSDTLTTFRGTISARALGPTGDGGNAEVSSAGVLDFLGSANLLAVRGATGTLLLDPYNITISTGADANHSGFKATGNNSVINTTTLANALATANVTVSTGTAGTQNGDIIVANSVAWTAATQLTLDAAGSIAVNDAINAASGSLALKAGGAKSVTTGTNGALTLGGNLSITSDALSLGANVTSKGAISIAPATSSATIGIGNSAAGTLNLSAVTLGRLQPGATSITIGSANGSGNIDVRNWAANAPLTIQSPAATGTINLLGTLSTGSAASRGTITLQAATITANSGSSITTDGQAVTLTAGANGSATNAVGISLTGTTFITAGGAISIDGKSNGGTQSGTAIYGSSTFSSDGGAISIVGKGSATGTGSNNHGVTISGASKVTSTTGNISIAGTAGGTIDSGSNFGVFLGGTGPGITTTNGGAITITGIGGGNGGTGGDNLGVFLNSGTIVGSGGAIAITGTGGATSGNTNYGVRITGGGSGTVSNKGAGSLTVTGTGRGAGDSSNDHGVYVTMSNGLVTESGTLTVDGTGNSYGTGGSANGVFVIAASGITSTAGGAINVKGTATGTGSYGGNRGISLDNGSIVGSGGAVTVIGTGGASSGNGNYGVYLNETNGRITNVDANGMIGTVTVTGVGKGTGNSGFDHGILLNPRSTLSTMGGALNVVGTGGGAGTGASSHGIAITADAGVLSTNGGTIAVQGSAGTGSGGNHNGILSRGSISGSGGAVTLTGTGGASGGNGNYGVFSAGSITNTGAGGVGATGVGGGTGNSAQGHGIYLGSGSVMSATRGLLQLVGTGASVGTGSTGYGVLVKAGAQLKTTGEGAIDVAGVGGTGNGGNNVGVQISGAINGSGGDVTIRGTGGTSGGAYNFGLAVTGANATVSNTSNGLLSVTGEAKGSASFASNIGVTIDQSAKGLTTAAGTLKVTAIGGSANGNSPGLYLTVASGINTSAGGAIIVDGTGSTGTGNNNHGIQISGGSIVGSGGGMNITGTGGASSGSANHGILVSGTGATISNVAGGTLTATGTGGGKSGSNSADNYGISLAVAKAITTEAGALNVTGVGSSIGSGGNGAGVSVTALQGLTTTKGGSLSVTGYGGRGSAGNNVGISVSNGSVVGSGGAMSLVGTGGASTGSNNYGVSVIGANGAISNVDANSLTGSLGISGKGNGTGNSGSNYGVFVSGSKGIATAGGALSVEGTGTSFGTDSRGIGVYLTNTQSAIASTSGAITVRGVSEGQGSAGTNRGVFVESASIVGGGGAMKVTGIGGTPGYGLTVSGTNSSISNSGSGTLDVIGIAGGNSSIASYGISINSAQGISTVDGALTLTGTGSAIKSATGSYGTHIAAGATVAATGSGSVTVAGTGGAASGGSNHGVLVNGTIKAAGGALTVTGTGGTATAGANHGVIVTGSNGGIANTGMGTVTVSGKGQGIDGSSDNYGVFVDAGSKGITAVDGSTRIVGKGSSGATGSAGYGVSITAINGIAATGQGAVMIDGEGGIGSGGNNVGVSIAAGSVVTTNGAISVDGRGGEARGSYNHGIVLSGNGAAITSSGSGSATINGIGKGTNASSSDYGVYITSNAKGISTAGGALTITGTGGGGSTGSNGYGVFINAAKGVATTNGAAITLSGFGGTGSGGRNYGVTVTDGTIQGSGGGISVTGIAGAASSGENIGVLVAGTSGAISNIGSGALAITGTGAGTASSTQNHGVSIAANGVSTEQGALSVSGNGGGSGSSVSQSHGVYVIANGGIRTSDKGTISVAGHGGGGSGGGNIGLYLYAGSITGSGGLVDITGVGGDATGSRNYGVAVGGSTGSVSNIGSGELRVSGQAGAGTDKSGYGVYITPNGTADAKGIYVADGALSVHGVGRSAGSDGDGIGVNVAANGGIKATGSGAVTVSGVGGTGAGGGNHGVAVSNGYITASGGNLEIVGNGGVSTGASNFGISLSTNGKLSNTGSGSVTIAGTGGGMDVAPGNFGVSLATSATISGAAPEIIASKGFYNDAGANAVSANDGRWLVYTESPEGNQYGGLDSGNTAIWNTALGGPVTASGHRYAFTYQPILTISSLDVAKVYGSDATSAVAASYAVSGYQAAATGAYRGDDAASALLGTPNVTSQGSTALASVAGSPYRIVAAQGGLASPAGYALSFNSPGVLTIDRAPLTGMITVADKVYDGTTTASIASRTLGGTIYGADADALVLGVGGADFVDKNAGSGIAVTGSDLVLTGAAAGNYRLDSITATTVADITPATLTGIIVAQNKVYDGTTSATLASRTLGGTIYGDDTANLTLGVGGASYATKNAGTGIVVTGTGLILDGAAAKNYRLSATTATSSADITPAALTGLIDAASKVYDGTSDAMVTKRALSGTIYGSDGDDLQLAFDGAAFSDRNVGSSITVEASGLMLTGAAATNYRLKAATATAIADITPATLTGIITAQNKVYDGTTTATLASRSLGGTIYGDDATGLALGVGGASFATKDAGTGIVVTGSGLILSGAASGNYRLSTAIATASADINPSIVTGIVAADDKVYDGTTSATLSNTGLTGTIYGEDGSDLSLYIGGAAFAIKDAGTGIQVSATGLMLTGAAAANYRLASDTATTSASIRPASLTGVIVADDKVYDGRTVASLSSKTLKGTIFGDDAEQLGVDVTSASFADRNAGSDITVTATGLALTGAAASNYRLMAATATTIADITPATLTGEITVSEKTYDGTLAAHLEASTLAGTMFGDDADNLSLHIGAVGFVSKDVGDHVPVKATGLYLAGSAARNYRLSATTATANGRIVPALLHASLSANNKVYDGTTVATLAGSSLLGSIYGDDAANLELKVGTTKFASADVGSAIDVTADELRLAGGASTNYRLANSSAMTKADITPAVLTALIAVANKVYDGTSSANDVKGTLSGSVYRDDAANLSLSVGNTFFASAEPGEGIAAYATGLALTGSAARNYRLSNSTGQAIASITPASAGTTMPTLSGLIPAISSTDIGVETGIGQMTVPSPDLPPSPAIVLPAQARYPSQLIRSDTGPLGTAANATCDRHSRLAPSFAESITRSEYASGALSCVTTARH